MCAQVLKAAVVLGVSLLGALAVLDSTLAADRGSTAPGQPAAYMSTGDALWDAYAQELVRLLATDVPSRTDPGRLPPVAEEVLEGWEAQFSPDPRYWQLRWWNAMLQQQVGLAEHVELGESPIRAIAPEGGADPVELLREGVRRGAADAATHWLLYRLAREKLDDLEARVVGEEELTAAEQALLPPEGLGERPSIWFEQRRDALLDALVAATPGHSRPLYERAMWRFELGDWSGGIADLTAGNAAPHNTMLHPFPWSFVTARLNAGADIGSEAAGGVVMLYSHSLIPLSNFIRIKDHAKSQLVRLNLGAPLSEAGVWHTFACRLGSMEGSSGVEWLVGTVVGKLLTRHLLVDMGDSFSVEQRDALYSLNGRLQGMTGVVRTRLASTQELAPYLDAHLPAQGLSAGELAAGIMENNLWPAEPLRDVVSAELQRMRLAGTELTEEDVLEMVRKLEELRAREASPVTVLREGQFRWLYDQARSEYSETYPKIRERYAAALRFDWEAVRWSDAEALDQEGAAGNE
jgi:hypothetical protein